VQHFLALREQWFILSQEQVVNLADLAQTILGLEASRWAFPPLLALLHCTHGGYQLPLNTSFAS